MPKRNYGFEKRQKDLNKKRKKGQKIKEPKRTQCGPPTSSKITVFDRNKSQAARLVDWIAEETTPNWGYQLKDSAAGQKVLALDPIGQHDFIMAAVAWLRRRKPLSVNSSANPVVAVSMVMFGLRLNHRKPVRVLSLLMPLRAIL